MWKETFEKAKKIVGTECSIYSGKSNPDDESDSESYESWSEASDDDKSVKENETSDKVIDENSKSKNDAEADQVTEVLEKLKVKEEDSEKKN